MTTEPGGEPAGAVSPRLATGHKWLLLVIPTLAAFGPVMQVVRPLYAFRIAAILLGGVTLVAVLRSRTRSTTAVGRATSWTAVAWLVGAGLAALNVSDVHAAFSDLLSVGCGLIVVLSALCVAPAVRVLRWLVTGWVVAFVATGLIAIFEVMTHHHLSNYVLTPYLRVGAGEPYVASTFGNPNLYALFLAMGAPVLLYLVRTSGSNRQRVGSVVLVLWLFVLVLYTGSRLGLLATIVAVVVWVVFTPKARFAPSTVVIALGLAAVVAISIIGPWGVITPDNSSVPPPKMSNTTKDEMLGKHSAGDSPNSGSVRVDLARRGWDMLVATHGLGVGPGNFATWIDRHGERYPLAGVRSPHNAVLELGAQYGVLTLAVTFLLFLVAVVSALRSRPRGKERPVTTLVLATAASFPLYAMCNSTFWAPPTTWVALAILLTAAAACTERGRPQVVLTRESEAKVDTR